MLYFWIIVQIILESLPVSSSGHVSLMQSYAHRLGYHWDWNSHSWIIDFLLHGPMIVILFIFFFTTWWQMILKKPIALTTLMYYSSWKSIGDLALFLLVADGITIMFWWLHIVPSIPLWIGFLITAVLLYATRWAKVVIKDFDASLSYAFVLGLAQSFSFLPGVSRFATTYAAGRLCGYSGPVSFAVSFLIQCPLLVAAFIKGCLALPDCPELMSNFCDVRMICIIVVSTVISYVLLRWIGDIIQKNRLWQFAWYMLIPSMLALFV